VKLVALLTWYDEPSWCLTELVASLAAAGIDHLVAVDGAYMLYPLARPQSPGEQAQAILAAAQGASVGVSLMYDEVNGGTREGSFPIRKFFRAQPTGIHLRHNHFSYWTGDGQLLYEGYCVAKPGLADCEHLPFVRCDHRGGRSTWRSYQAQVYYDRRKEFGAELVPG